MFQRRHYEAIAKALCISKLRFQCPICGNEIDDLVDDNYMSTVQALAEMFKADNPLFDNERFRDACYGRGE